MELSTGIALVSAFIAVVSYLGAHWERVRKTALDSVEGLLSDRTQSARAIVGRAARTDGKLSAKDHREFTDAVFTLLWAIQRADLSSRSIKKTAIAPIESRWLYRQLEVIVPDLSDAMAKHKRDQTDWGSPLNMQTACWRSCRPIFSGLGVQDSSPGFGSFLESSHISTSARSQAREGS